MRRSVQPAGKQTNLENDASKEPYADKDKSKYKISKIDYMDNGTMVEALKYMNYCQLAKKSLISKRFRNLIQTHRNSLALLYVDYIGMRSLDIARTVIKVFYKKLSLEAYNEWLIRNNYLKQIPFESQVISEESTQSITNDYGLAACACYEDSSHRERNDTTRVFFAHVKLNHENWPVFQHFVYIATDPFIYINRMVLTDQNDFLNLLAGAINSDHDRLQCKQFNFHLNVNSQKSFTWIKNHVSCNKLSFYGEADLNENESLLDFFVTGAHCTPSINFSYDRHRDLSKVVSNFLQMFMDFKNSCENQLVEVIDSFVKRQSVDLFKRDYADFLVKEARHEGTDSTQQVFEFVNNDIGKKLLLTTETYDMYLSHFSIKINNL